MKKIEIAVYSRETTLGVIKMPQRRCPGSLIQGDSLDALAGVADSIFEKVKELGEEELMDDACELKDLLNERLIHYETVLKNQIF